MCDFCGDPERQVVSDKAYKLRNNKKTRYTQLELFSLELTEANSVKLEGKVESGNE